MSLRALVADDDDLFRATVKDELVGRGCEVIEATDGVDALDALAMAAAGHVEWPHVLVLDVRMPDLSGLGVFSLLRGLRERPPTFFVTGLADPSIDVLVARLGAERLFRKPVDVDELVAAILDAAKKRLTSFNLRKRRRIACGS